MLRNIVSTHTHTPLVKSYNELVTKENSIIKSPVIVLKSTKSLKTSNKLVTIFLSIFQFRSEENFNSSCMLSNQDLLTIDMETIATL